MPAMNDLLESLQDNTPSTEMELRSLLEETGYDLVMREPSGEDDASMESEADMGPDDDTGDVDVEEVSSDDLPEDIKAMLKTMMGGKPDHSKHDLSHGGRKKMRVKVARVALNNSKKGDSYE